MAGWLDRQFRRIRGASSDYELEEVRREMESHLPPSLVNGSDNHRTNDVGLSLGGADDGTHLHLHLGAGGQAVQGGGVTSDQPPPQNGPAPPNAGGQGGDVETRLAALEASVATLTQQVSDLTGGNGSEEEVQLEEPNSKDARSYIMRRGSKIRKVGDQGELLVPVKNPEMIGETDLPGIQDLNYEGGSSEGRAVVLKTGDSFDMETVWQDTMAKAEIIVPGIRVPTFDGRVSQEITTRRLCAFRRQTLDAAIDNQDTSDLVASLTELKTKDQVRQLTCDSARMAFNVIATAIGGNRNDNMVMRQSVGDSAVRKTGGTPSIAEINRRNKEAYRSGQFKRPQI